MAAGREFTQPRAHLIAQLCSLEASQHLHVFDFARPVSSFFFLSSLLFSVFFLALMPTRQRIPLPVVLPASNRNSASCSLESPSSPVSWETQFNTQLHIHCTEMANKDGTWLREISSCSCLTVLPGLPGCCLTNSALLLADLCTCL